MSTTADVIARVATIEDIVDRHRVPVAAAALQFVSAHPQVISVIPGMNSPSRVNEATQWLQMSIPPPFWRELRDRGLVRADAPLPVTA